MNNYTVFVGGFEVNDFYLTKIQADNLAAEYFAAGYNDVFVLECEDVNELEPA